MEPEEWFTTSTRCLACVLCTLALRRNFRIDKLTGCRRATHPHYCGIWGPNTVQFLELVITTDADRLSCRLWNSVARNTGNGDSVLTRFPLLAGGTNTMGRLSWIVGAIHRIIQRCYGNDDIVISILELIIKLELEVSGWWTGLLRTAIAKAEQSIVMKGEYWEKGARLLYQVWVALKLCPETRGVTEPRYPSLVRIEEPV